MRSSMFARARALAIVLALTAALAPTESARAQGDPGDAGVCHLRVTIEFASPMKSIRVASTTPAYTMTVDDGSDFYTPTPEPESCIYNFGGILPLRSTAVAVYPNTQDDLWTCEAVVGWGGWDQGWWPDPGFVSRHYIITGTWGAWTIYIRDGSQSTSDIYSIVHLTLRERIDNTDIGFCHTPTNAAPGITRLELDGVQTFLFI